MSWSEHSLCHLDLNKIMIMLKIGKFPNHSLIYKKNIIKNSFNQDESFR